jgi:hypothetical protein
MISVQDSPNSVREGGVLGKDVGFSVAGLGLSSAVSYSVSFRIILRGESVKSAVDFVGETS